MLRKYYHKISNWLFARRLLVAVVIVLSVVLPSAQTTAKPHHEYVFPFAKVAVTYSKDHLNYPATDVHGCYAHVLAPTKGVVVDVELKDTWDEKLDTPGTRGGLTVTMHGDDRVRYYFAHLGRVKVTIGDVVEPGQWIGVMGSSGNARVTKCHTHFGISRICPHLKSNILQGEIWPWKYLDAWRRGIDMSPVEAKNRVIKKFPAACEPSKP